MCEKTVEIYVERGFDHIALDRPCGGTGPRGELLLCEVCERKRDQIEQNTIEEL